MALPNGHNPTIALTWGRRRQHARASSRPESPPRWRSTSPPRPEDRSRAPDTSRGDGDRADRRCRTARSRDRSVRRARSRAPRAEAEAGERGAGRQLRAERRMRAEQEPRRQFGPAEAARRLAEAGGREIQQAEPLEERRIVHRRVQRGDQAFGRVQFRERRPLVRRQAPRRGPRPGDVRSSRSTQPQDAEQRQRKAGREQRIDHAGGRRQQRPRRARRPARCGTRAAVRARRAASARRRPELLGDRRQRSPAGDPMPAAPSAAPMRSRHRIGQRRAGAGEAVVEAQHPDPSAGKHMVHRRIVDRVRRRLRRSAAGRPTDRRLRSACRAPASAAASDTAPLRGRARDAGTLADRWRRSRNAP